MRGRAVKQKFRLGTEVGGRRRKPKAWGSRPRGDMGQRDGTRENPWLEVHEGARRVPGWPSQACRHPWLVQSGGRVIAGQKKLGPRDSWEDERRSAETVVGRARVLFRGVV
jgi:hypothetical protein